MGPAALNRRPMWPFPPQSRVGMAAATALVSTVLAFSPGCSSGGGPGRAGAPCGPVGEVRVLNETSAVGPAVVSVVLPLLKLAGLSCITIA